MAEDTNNAAASRLQGVAERAHGYVDQAKDGAATSAERVAKVAHRGIDQAAGTATAATDWIAEKTDTYTRVPQDMMASACDTIRAKPLKAVGIALAVGYVLGKISR